MIYNYGEKIKVDNRKHNRESKHINLAANVCGYTPINLGKIIKEGVLADVPSIHRMTIDRQVERGKKNDID